MFLPIGDDPNPSRKAWVTWLLMVINVGVYVVFTLPLSMQAADPGNPLLPLYLRVVQEATGGTLGLRELIGSISAYDLFVFEHGYKAGQPAVDDALTSMFLHGGFAHLAGNMLFLWIYGDNVEAQLGRVKYLLAYLGTGIAGTMLQSLFADGSLIPVVGASGAISGVLGFYFVFFPKNRIKVFTLLFPFYVGTINIPARWVLGVYLIVDNLVPFFLVTSQTGVAHGAHIGGFVAGFILARLWAAEEPGGALSTRRALRGMPGEVPPTAHAEATPPAVIRRLLDRGNVDAAAHEYAAVFNTRWRRSIPPEDVLEIAGYLARSGHLEAALGVYQRLVRDNPRGSWAAQAHVAAGNILLHHLGRRTSAYQHFAEALELNPDRSTEQRAREGIQLVHRMQRVALGEA